MKEYIYSTFRVEKLNEVINNILSNTKDMKPMFANTGEKCVTTVNIAIIIQTDRAILFHEEATPLVAEIKISPDRVN